MIARPTIAERIPSSNLAPSSSKRDQPPRWISSLIWARPAANGNGISGQCSCLVDRSVRRKLIHDFCASAECAHWQATADDFAECGEIRPDIVELLRATGRESKARHYLVENEKHAFEVALRTQSFKKACVRVDTIPRWRELVPR